MQTHGTDRRENCRELSWKGRMSMLAKYVLCILTIEWAVLGMRLLEEKIAENFHGKEGCLCWRNMYSVF